MQVTTYSVPADFLAKAKIYLEQEEVKNGLMLGIVSGLVQHPERIRQAPYLATIEDDKGLALAAMITPPFNVVIYSDRPETQQTSLLTALAASLPAAGFNPPGVMAPIELATPFAEIWSKRAEKTFQLKMNLRAFELREVNWPKLPAGKLRLATESDIPLITDFLQKFEEEAQAKVATGSFEEAARQRIAREFIFVWEDENGQVVSMAAKNRPTERGVTVGLVYTPPELRGLGYASACVASLSQYLLDEGFQYCTLFTDLANPTSNSIYQKMGYKPVCDFAEYEFL